MSAYVQPHLPAYDSYKMLYKIYGVVGYTIEIKKARMEDMQCTMQSVLYALHDEVE